MLSGSEKEGFEYKLSWVVGMKETKEKHETMRYETAGTIKFRSWLEAGEPVTTPPVCLGLDPPVNNLSMCPQKNQE